jgi:hypothetical protein
MWEPSATAGLNFRSKAFRCEIQISAGHPSSLSARTRTSSKNSQNEEFTDDSYDIGWIGDAIGVNCQKLREGESLGTFYGPVWIGLDELGHDLFKNANPVGLVNPEDWEVDRQCLSRLYAGLEQLLYMARL